MGDPWGYSGFKRRLRCVPMNSTEANQGKGRLLVVLGILGGARDFAGVFEESQGRSRVFRRVPESFRAFQKYSREFQVRPMRIQGPRGRIQKRSRDFIWISEAFQKRSGCSNGCQGFSRVFRDDPRCSECSREFQGTQEYCRGFKGVSGEF